GRPSADVGIRRLCVSRNLDGRQEIFALGDDHGLWQKWQTAPSNGWSEWKSLGRPLGEISLGGSLTVGRNQDGRQEVFAVGGDGNVWQIWQTAPNGAWSNWAKLNHPPPGIRPSDRITAGRNRDGRQQLFVMALDDALWNTWQLARNGG